MVIFCGSGATGAINKLVDVLNLRLPADLDARYGLAARSPPTSARSCSSAPTSTTPTSCRGASRSPTSWSIDEDADGRIDLGAARAPSSSATPTGRSRSAASRPRRTSPASLRHARDRRAAPPPRRALVLGLRRRRALRRDRDEPDGRARRDARVQGRDLHLAAQVHRRPGHARRARRQEAPVQEPRARGARRRDGRVRQRRRSTATSTTPSTARRAARRRSSSRSAPGSSSSSRRPSASTAIRERGGGVHPPRHRVVEQQPQPRDPRQPRRLRGSRSCSFVCGTGDGATSHHNFVVALLERSLRHPGARRLLVRRALRPPPARDRRAQRAHGSSARSSRGCEGIKPGWVRVNFNYFISRGRVRLHRRGRQPGRRARLAAAARLHASIPTPASGATRRGRPRPRCGLATLSYRTGKLEYRSRMRPSPSGRWRATSRPRAASSPRPRAGSAPPRRRRRRSRRATSRRCAGSPSRARWRAERCAAPRTGRPPRRRRRRCSFPDARRASPPRAVLARRFPASHDPLVHHPRRRPRRRPHRHVRGLPPGARGRPAPHLRAARRTPAATRSRSRTRATASIAPATCCTCAIPRPARLALSWIGDDWLEVERRSMIWSNGTYTRYPFQANTFGLPPAGRVRVPARLREGALRARTSRAPTELRGVLPPATSARGSAGTS